jgi:hypothetical protein
MTKAARIHMCANSRQRFLRSSSTCENGSALLRRKKAHSSHSILSSKRYCPVSLRLRSSIAQVDVLAEIVALRTLLAGRRTLPLKEASDFRNDLGAREPALAIIRDAHNNHKHGALIRKTAKAASRGQRPETVTKYGYFLGHWFLDRHPTRYNYLAFVLNDGTEKSVSIMLDEAMDTWNRELTRLRL